MFTNIYINYLSYFAVGMVLLAMGVAAFVMCTKNKEFAMIAQGNKSAGIIIAGRTVGLAIVLYSAIANSVSLLDLVIGWYVCCYRTYYCRLFNILTLLFEN